MGLMVVEVEGGLERLLQVFLMVTASKRKLLWANEHNAPAPGYCAICSNRVWTTTREVRLYLRCVYAEVRRGDAFPFCNIPTTRKQDLSPFDLSRRSRVNNVLVCMCLLTCTHLPFPGVGDQRTMLSFF